MANASDWKFASHEGYLSWTIPALPSGGQRLYSKLTPTLLVGQLQADDAVPVDYVEIPSITAVHLKTAIAIQCERSNGESYLLVADTADDARAWYDSLRQAMRNSERYASSAAVQTSPLVATGPRMSWESNTAQTPYSTLSSALREEKFRQTAATSRFGGADQPQSGAGLTHHASSGAANETYQATPAAPPMRTASPVPQQPVAYGATPAASAAPYQQQQQQQQRGFDSGFDDRPPLAPPVFRGDESVAGSNSRASWPSQAPVGSSLGMRPLPPQDSSNNGGGGSSSFDRPMPLPQRAPQQSSGPQDTSRFTGAYETPLSSPQSRPPWSSTDNTVDSHRGGAQATSVAVQEERPVPGAGRPLDLRLSSAGTTTYGTGGRLGLGSYGGGGVPPTPSSAAPSADWGLGSSNSRPLPSEPYSRPLDPAGQLRYANPTTASAAGMARPGMYDEAAAASFGAFGRMPDVSMNPASRFREGPAPPGGRAGMMVDLPGTQAINRSIAPNVSAVWKEWSAPDGATYYFHEPTQTLQRLRPGSHEYETVVEGTGEVPEEDLIRRSHREGMPTVNLNTNMLRNLQAYGEGGTGTGIDTVRGADVYRTEVLAAAPRGAYSPSRHATVEALAAPRVANQGYQGKRLHRLTLQPADEPGQAIVAHQVQSLDAAELAWDRGTGAVFSKDPDRQGAIGSATLYRQWEHVRKILNCGRYFKKHALRSNSEAFRFVFLTGDNSYVCCVPTSQVMLNVHKDPLTFGSATDTIQYYGPETRALPVNSITHVVLGTHEPMVYRRKSLDPESTFVIVGRTHALILECNTAEEAKFFCDAWNFFLYYSKPVNPKTTRTPQMTAPVTHGTRTGIAF